MDLFIAFLRALTAQNLEDGNVYYLKDKCRFWLGLGVTDWADLLGEMRPGNEKYLYVTKQVDTDMWCMDDPADPDTVSGMKKVKIDLYKMLCDVVLYYGFYHGGTINQEDLDKVIEELIKRIENWEYEQKDRLYFPFWWYKGHSSFEGFQD